ncbi:A kinase (PRKA) anchor protein 1b [Betta splendens]|uniref:A kinase (PRKA) anchor protein 1b n=1 Tax=Betta splendens TaxID=158456 RepID=A0A6P7P2N5_BETSP|nr:A kinase (PRKA) anchor protein 1b [Betta splendens]XP_029026536.1 A kinase (PRKA) anchor protein 1b [Betta splendens]
MPLRFRSVVPYTLPGILGFIGWWWYISRKKEHLVICEPKDGTPSATVCLKASPAEGSSCVVEKDTISPKNVTEISTRRLSKVSKQSFENEIIFDIQVQNTVAAAPLEQCSEEATPDIGRLRDVVNNSSVLPTEKDDVQEPFTEHGDLKKPFPIAFVTELEKHIVKEPPFAVTQDNLPCRSDETTWSTPTNTCLSDAERPEPEGEVAKNHSVIDAQDTVVVSAITSSKMQKVNLSTEEYLEMPSSVRDSHQHILTSTPTVFGQISTEFTTVQNTTTASVTPEDLQLQSSSGEHQNLELLAARLVTEVISAATQDVLGVTSCQVTYDNHPSCITSTALCHSRLCFLQEPITGAHKHHYLLTNSSIKGHQSREATQKEGAQMHNGSSSSPLWEPVEVGQRVHQNVAQRGLWPTLSPQSAQTTPLLNTQLKGDDVPLLACATHHSVDYNCSKNIQSSMVKNSTDVIQATDFSATEVGKHQSPLDTSNEATISPIISEEIHGFNGIELRNGARETCEVEADHSGGSDVNSMDSVDSGCTMGPSKSLSNHTASSDCELIIWEIEVPKHLVGRLIGKQGRYVSFLKQTSGAMIYISTLPYTQEFQICHIEGTQQQIDKALSLIGKKFKDLDLTNVYAPQPPPLTLPSLPMTSWLLLPSGVTVEVIVVNIVSAGHIFVQQHTHPTYHALRSLDQQMFLCYSQPGTPSLPSPAEVGVICAAPAVEGAWWRAQVITFYKETSEVEIRYVDYGGYDRVKIDTLRQIRSDFVTLPFQGAEVLLDNIAPLPGEDRFSVEATSALEDMSRGVALLAQVSNYDNGTGLPLVHLWNMVGDEVISVNRTLADKGLGSWVDGF